MSVRMSPADPLASFKAPLDRSQTSFDPIDRVIRILWGNHWSGFFMAMLLVGQAAFVSATDETTSWQSFQNSGAPVVEQSLPTEWTPESVAWTSEIEGYGQSTPLVHGELIYVTSTSGENKEHFHLTTFQLASGEKVWQVDFDNPTPEKNDSFVSRAAPTPVIDESGCYVFYEGGVVAAVSHDGKKTWSRNLVEDYGAIEARHGLASSLEQNVKHLFVWVERTEEPYLVALDKETGETNWKTPGLGSTTWSSPRLVSVGDSQQLVCSASGKLAGYDPESGDKLWEFDEISNNTSCTPIPAGKNCFLIGASEGRGSENAGRGAANNGVLEVALADDSTWSIKFKWQAQRATSSFGSPIVFGDVAYFVNRTGVLFGSDLQTGKEQPPLRLKCGGVWATPLVADNKLYLFGQKGITSVVDLATGKEISTNETWQSEEKADQEGEQSEGQQAYSNEHVIYAATAAPPYLLIRRGDTIFAIK